MIIWPRLGHKLIPKVIQSNTGPFLHIIYSLHCITSVPICSRKRFHIALWKSKIENDSNAFPQVLNMTGASLPVLHSDMFTRAGLPNLQRLFLRYKDQTKAKTHNSSSNPQVYIWYYAPQAHIGKRCHQKNLWPKLIFWTKGGGRREGHISFTWLGYRTLQKESETLRKPQNIPAQTKSWPKNPILGLASLLKFQEFISSWKHNN